MDQLKFALSNRFLLNVKLDNKSFDVPCCAVSVDESCITVSTRRVSSALAALVDAEYLSLKLFIADSPHALSKDDDALVADFEVIRDSCKIAMEELDAMKSPPINGLLISVTHQVKLKSLIVETTSER